MSRKEDDHPVRITLPIERDQATLWLQGGAGQSAAREAVAVGCLSWLKFPAHAQGLSESDAAEICSAAMAETYSKTQEQKISVDEALYVLQKSLNTRRAAEKRKRHSSLTDYDLPDTSVDFEGEIIRREFCLQLARLLERHLQAALLSLSEKDQDVLVTFYGLQDVGDPTREPAHLKLSPAAEKKALYRARRRLSQQLESLLIADISTVNRFDRTLYEAALRMVRGGNVRIPAWLTGDR